MVGRFFFLFDLRCLAPPAGYRLVPILPPLPLAHAHLLSPLLLHLAARPSRLLCCSTCTRWLGCSLENKRRRSMLGPARLVQQGLPPTRGSDGVKRCPLLNCWRRNNTERLGGACKVRSTRSFSFARLRALLTATSAHADHTSRNRAWVSFEACRENKMHAYKRRDTPKT